MKNDISIVTVGKQEVALKATASCNESHCVPCPHCKFIPSFVTQDYQQLIHNVNRYNLCNQTGKFLHN